MFVDECMEKLETGLDKASEDDLNSVKNTSFKVEIYDKTNWVDKHVRVETERKFKCSLKTTKLPASKDAVVFPPEE